MTEIAPAHRVRVSWQLAWCSIGLVLDALLLVPPTLFLPHAGMLDGIILRDLTLPVVAWLVHVLALPALLGTTPGSHAPALWLPLHLVLLVLGTAVIAFATTLFTLMLGTTLMAPMPHAPFGTPRPILDDVLNAMMAAQTILAGTFSGCLLHGLRQDLRPPPDPYPAEGNPLLPRLRSDALGGAAAMMVTLTAGAVATTMLQVPRPGFGVLVWTLPSALWIGAVIAPLALLPHLILTAPGVARGGPAS